MLNVLIDFAKLFLQQWVSKTQKQVFLVPLVFSLCLTHGFRACNLKQAALCVCGVSYVDPTCLLSPQPGPQPLQVKTSAVREVYRAVWCLACREFRPQTLCLLSQRPGFGNEPRSVLLSMREPYSPIWLAALRRGSQECTRQWP